MQKCCLSKSRLCSFPPSAGIGRTGVLVTMETSMCLIERNLPVYPLDIVRKMRDQRAMMVQTSVSRNAVIKILTMARPARRALQVRRPKLQGTESLAHGHRACQGLSGSNTHPIRVLPLATLHFCCLTVCFLPAAWPGSSPHCTLHCQATDPSCVCPSEVSKVT